MKFSSELDIFSNYEKSEDQFQDVNDNIDFLKFIDFLNAEEKIIIAMYYSKNYTTREISNILKINESTIRSKILRAKAKIKEKFGGTI